MRAKKNKLPGVNMTSRIMLLDHLPARRNGPEFLLAGLSFGYVIHLMTKVGKKIQSPSVLS